MLLWQLTYLTTYDKLSNIFVMVHLAGADLGEGGLGAEAPPSYFDLILSLGPLFVSKAN